MRRWLLGATLLMVVGVLSGCGQDELRKEKAALASSSARLESRASILDARESSLDKVRASTESSSIAESESQAIAESESQEKADSQASSASAAFSSQAESVSAAAESVSAAAESISQNQISSPVQAVDWVKQQRGEQDDHGKITWQASTTGEKDGQHYFVVQGRREDGKVDDALDLIVLSTGEIMTRDSAAGKALVE